MTTPNVSCLGVLYFTLTPLELQHLRGDLTRPLHASNFLCIHLFTLHFKLLVELSWLGFACESCKNTQQCRVIPRRAYCTPAQAQLLASHEAKLPFSEAAEMLHIKPVGEHHS